jgi:hypothetical protein
MTTRTKETELKITELKITIGQLEEKRDAFVERLDEGAIKIEEARRQGRDVTAWETFWLGLLHQYELVSDKLRDSNNQLRDLQQA